MSGEGVVNHHKIAKHYRYYFVSTSQKMWIWKYKLLESMIFAHRYYQADFGW